MRNITSQRSRSGLVWSGLTALFKIVLVLVVVGALLGALPLHR
jgi:hypothetical protein